MTECVTTYAKENIASSNVLHKLGFRDGRTIPYECSGGDVSGRADWFTAYEKEAKNSFFMK